jgi:hypothetical protein
MGARETRQGGGDRFPTATEGLVEAAAPELVELAHGDSFDLALRNDVHVPGGRARRTLT